MQNNRIRKVTPGGVVTTVAGSGSAAFSDGTGTAASFNGPTGIAIDASGTLYVADQSNHRIRMVRFVSASAVVTTIAGTGSGGFLDGSPSLALFNNPSGLAIDASGNLFLTDRLNYRLRMLQAASSWYVSTWAGTASSGYQNGAPTSATLNQPTAVALNGNSSIYVADSR